MKNIFLAASFLILSCNYKSESDKEFERLILRNDCLMINSNRVLIKYAEDRIKIQKRIIKAQGRETTQDKKIIENELRKIDSLKIAMDSMRLDLAKRTKHQ